MSRNWPFFSYSFTQDSVSSFVYRRLGTTRSLFCSLWETRRKESEIYWARPMSPLVLINFYWKFVSFAFLRRLNANFSCHTELNNVEGFLTHIQSCAIIDFLFQNASGEKGKTNNFKLIRQIVQLGNFHFDISKINSLIILLCQLCVVIIINDGLNPLIRRLYVVINARLQWTCTIESSTRYTKQIISAILQRWQWTSAE